MIHDALISYIWVLYFHLQLPAGAVSIFGGGDDQFKAAVVERKASMDVGYDTIYATLPYCRFLYHLFRSQRLKEYHKYLVSLCAVDVDPLKH